MYFFPPVDAKASADTGFRTVQTSGLNNFGGTVELMEENYHIVNEMSDLTSFIVGFHAEYTTSKELMEGVAALAQKLKSPVWLHNSETKLEVAECKERWGMTPTQLTDSLGMYEYGGGGYHCVWFEEPDFEIFKKHHLTAVTNPASNLKLASGICPTKRFVDEGIAMAIGTDGPASNNCLDMFREMFLPPHWQRCGRWMPSAWVQMRSFTWQQPAVRMQCSWRTVTVWRWAKRRILS